MTQKTLTPDTIHTAAVSAADIIAAMQRKCTTKEKEMIEKACAFAEERHAGQVRYSGEPYCMHAFEVGRLLAEIGMPTEVVTAGILHDTIEDTNTTVKELEKAFTKKIAFFVDGVSHLGKVRYQGLDMQVKSLQKLLIATSKDIRVIIIKLMDRLHNMRTLEAVPKTKQKRIAKETQQVYAPIADRLGMGMLKTELEELAFKHLNHTTYTALKKDIDTAIGSVAIDGIEEDINNTLANKDITDITMSSRIKSVYSTYMKMRHKKYTLEQIQDLAALRIVVQTVPDAYSVLGVLHAQWRSIPGAFKDYISLPKPNGYQALHTRIIIDKHVLEVQILTHAMQKHAQFGIAAHFVYKDKRHGTIGLDMAWFDNLLAGKRNGKQVSWAEHITAMQQEKEIGNMNFLENMQADFLQERMFIFTPKGEVVDLPRNATPVDFAFAIHSDIGRHAEGAFVNGKYVSLRHELQNGDVVNIATGRKKTVNKKWLDWVKTAEARARIRQFTKKNF